MSTSYSQNSSSSATSPVQTPENDIMNQIAQTAQGLSSQMLSWAQGVFAQTSAVTNAAVGNFFTVSQNMLGLSNSLTGQYNSLFAPENAQLVADANSYASPARMSVDMGMAGATQAQAGNSALQSSEEALRSYGIDPSSGRYASLDQASKVQNAANIAGAENTQRVADITTGQNLRSEAVNVGAQLPAAIANINNTAIQANTGASNAELANANTGANLMNLPNAYLQTGMQVKMPFSQSTSSGSGFSTGSSPSKGSSSSPSGGGGAGSGAGGSSASGPAWMPQHGGAPAIGSGPAKAQPGSSISGANPNPYADPTGQNYDPMSGIDPNSFDGQDASSLYQPDPNGATMGIGQPDANSSIDYMGANGNTPSDPFGNQDFGQTLDPNSAYDAGLSSYGGADQTFGSMGGGTDTQYGNISYDPSANSASLPSGWQDPASSMPTDNSTYSDPNAGYSDPSSYDSSSYDYSSGADYARGGAIPFKPHTRRLNSNYMAPSYANGGPVSPQASPSRGARVDDVQARGPGNSNIHLNAAEFIIPQDVALWKGQEFFQNLIDQSRKRRVTASAQPTQQAAAR